MELHKVLFDVDLIKHLIDGHHAADPLDGLDADVLRSEWDETERSRDASCGLTASMRLLVAAAYSLGARHALEQSERWTIAPAAECDEDDQVDLSQDVQAPPAYRQNWRGWEELTERERCNALRARPTMSAREAYECMWVMAGSGWDVAYPPQWSWEEHS